MKRILYSIGYSGFNRKDFIHELRSRRITVVVDVRSIPFSKYFTDYNQDTLKNILKQNGILYRSYAYEFGAQQKNLNLYTSEGCLDFARFSQSEPFLRGIERLCAGMDQGYSFVLMCAEKNPIICHRAILVSRAFAQRGHSIIHLLPNGVTLTQEEVELQLLEMYFPDRTQLTMFEEQKSEAELIELAYQKQNAVIGFRERPGRPYSI